MKKAKKILTLALSLTAITQILPVVTAEENSDYNYYNDTVKFYDEWKDKYICQDKYVTDEIQYYVNYSEDSYQNDNISVPVTVSEAHGYGMLITACMSDYDENAHDIFDGMYRYFKAHPSDIGKNLMSWQQCDNGSALIDGAEEGSMTGGSCDSASDGDIDIAYSLLIADSIWGSDSDINYKAEATAVINDIMTYEVNKKDWFIQLGDWVYYCDETENYYNATRASDFIIQYFPIFAEVTGDERWNNVYNGTYKIINELTENSETGLLPDFIIKNSNEKFEPSPANFLEDVTDGMYAYNSCRTPWRIGMDVLINNNKDAKAFSDKINNFIINKTSGDPYNIMAGYKLDGTAYEDYNDLCFVAPFLITAKCGDNKEWENNLWECIRDYGDDVYYGDTIKMLCMISYCDKWIVPYKNNPDTTEPTTNNVISTETTMPDDTDTHTFKGDANVDGLIDVADVVAVASYVGNAEGNKLKPQGILNADVHNTGNGITSDDALMIQQYLAKIITEF